MRILIFGDSIAHGAWDDEKGGWVERLKEYLFSIKKHTVYNLGISGATTEDLLERFENDAKTRIKVDPEKEITIMFAIGVNDSAYLKSKDTNWVDKNKFQENLIKLINISRNITNIILFVIFLDILINFIKFS